MNLFTRILFSFHWDEWSGWGWWKYFVFDHDDWGEEVCFVGDFIGTEVDVLVVNGVVDFDLEFLGDRVHAFEYGDDLGDVEGVAVEGDGDLHGEGVVGELVLEHEGFEHKAVQHLELGENLIIMNRGWVGIRGGMG